ncbi:MAG: ECF-type sigma factor [Pseudomonadota bacterium]
MDGEVAQGSDQLIADELGLSAALYLQLKTLARAQLRKQARSPAATLNTTALVHEAYLKLGDLIHHWDSDRHFYATMAKVMRHILIDAARRRARTKHGADQKKLSLEGLVIEPAAIDSEVSDLLALDAALNELGQMDERLERVIEMRYFGGMSVAEVAELLNVSEPTIKRDTRTARAFLASQLS